MWHGHPIHMESPALITLAPTGDPQLEPVVRAWVLSTHGEDRVHWSVPATLKPFTFLEQPLAALIVDDVI